MQTCKCEHWQQCPTCKPHRFDAEGNVLPPEPTPLEDCREKLGQALEVLEKFYNYVITEQWLRAKIKKLQEENKRLRELVERAND